ncbi:MAG: Asp23/Gls24 family envelope stress response protein [Chloroflexia bacterium]
MEMHKAPQGRIEVSPQVVAAIAEEAVLQCYGIVGLASRRQSGVWTQLPEAGSRGGVVVRLEGEQVVLDLYVIIEYGTRICEVARNVMSTVKFAVEQTLGIPVGQVNVNVQGIHLSNPQS